MVNSVFTASIFVSLALLFGRLSGLFREIILANKFGVSSISDSLVLLLTLPDFMVSLLLAGGFNAALIPFLKQQKNSVRIFIIRKVSLYAVIFFILISVILILMSKNFILIFLPATNFSQVPNLLESFSISLLTLPLAALIGVSSSYLNTQNKFYSPILSVLVFNTIVCLYLLIPSSTSSVLLNFSYILCFAMICRLIIQLLFMSEFLTYPPGKLSCWPVGFMRKFISGVAAISLMVGSLIIFRSLHAANGEGNLAVFNYAIRLFELPTAILVAPLSLVLLPTLSALTASNSFQFNKYVSQALLTILTLTFIATIVGVMFMKTIVALLYEHGVLLPIEIERIVLTASILLLALPSFAMLQICSTALNADGRPHVLFINSLVGLIFGIVICYLLSVSGFPYKAAPFGFVVFSVVSALLCLKTLFNKWFPSQNFLMSMGYMFVKLAFVGTLISLILSSLSHTSFAMEIVFALLTTALMLGVNYKSVTLLKSLKTDNS